MKAAKHFYFNATSEAAPKKFAEWVEKEQPEIEHMTTTTEGQNTLIIVVYKKK